MTDPRACDDALQDLWLALGWSLLRYLDAADPWTPSAEARETLDRLAAGQQESFRQVADLLVRRHVLPDRGGYPSEFTQLHYLALDFLLGRLTADQQSVVAAADAALAACARSPATQTLEAVRTREAGHLDTLRGLAGTVR